MVELNSDIGIEDEDEPESVNKVMEQESEDEGADAINEHGVNNSMDSTAPRFELKRSLQRARNTGLYHHHRFEREFQYMQKSVKNIRSEANIKK